MTVRSHLSEPDGASIDVALQRDPDSRAGAETSGVVNQLLALDRRRFLVLAGALAVGSAHANEFRQSTRNDIARPTPLELAWARALESHRPLVVMLLSNVRNEWRRGVQWGMFLDRATQATLAELELCELSAASGEEARALWPQAALTVTALPCALIVTPDGKQGRVNALHLFQPWAADPHDAAQRVQLRAWQDELARAIHECVAPDSKRFEELARRTLGDRSGSQETWETELAIRCRNRLLAADPVGAIWAHSGPCGQVLDRCCKQLRAGPPCGTGALPDPSRRFLWLFTGAENAR